MNVVIIGSGAMGLLLFKQLAPQADIRVKLRNYDNSSSSFTFTDLHGLSSDIHYTTADKKFLRSADILLICVKAFHIKDVIADIENYASPSAVIILMHNGMGVIDELSLNKLTHNPIYTMLTTQAACKLAPNHLKHTGLGLNQIGNVINPIADSKIKSVLNDLSSDDITLQFRDNISLLQWKKLSINCAINALTAIDNVPNGDLAKQKYSKTIELVTREVVMVAELDGTPLDFKELLNAIKTVIHNTSTNSSSMREDVLNKRKTEINYINGYIHKQGLKYGYLTPCNTDLLERIQNIEANY